MRLIIEKCTAADIGTVEFQANEQSEVIVLKKEIALKAAQDALDVIVCELPADSLTVATVRYVMNEMKELLYSMRLKS